MPPADDAEDSAAAPGAAGQRLLRPHGDHGPSLSEQLAARLRGVSYASPLHRLRLRGRFPLKLLAVPEDPVAGDPGIAERILAGRLPHAGYNPPTRTLTFDDPAAPAAWREWASSFAWLRDLAAGAERTEGARAAEPLVARFLAAHGDYDPLTWRADLVGRRLSLGIAHAPYILSSPDPTYRSAVLNSMARWARHLDRAAEQLPDGLPKLVACAGWLTAGLMIPGGEARARRAEAVLERTLGAVLLADGGVASRAPLDQLELLELLLGLDAAYVARALKAPQPVAAAIARLTPALRGVLMGDGLPGSWHGSPSLPAGRVALALRLTGINTRPSRQGQQSGYQRLGFGRTVLVADAGPPPLARVAPAAHAGTLAFELSDGTQRIVVNCGGVRGLPQPLPEALAAGLRTTAAHSTLVLADTNSTRIRPDGALGRGVEEVVVSRQESEEGGWLDLLHDGYVRRFGVRHRRRLFLSADGSDLRGEDVLEPAAGRRSGRSATADVRFHLGDGVEATPTADGQGALLKLADGRVWQFRARGGTLAVERSLWIDPAGAPRPTQQLVLSAPSGSSLNWSFRRAGK